MAEPIKKSQSLQWRHNGRSGVSNHLPHDCLLNRLFRPRSKKTSKFRVTGLCAENSPVTGEFPAQMASNAENVSIWWLDFIARLHWDTRDPHLYHATFGAHRSVDNVLWYSLWLILPHGYYSHPTPAIVTIALYIMETLPIQLLAVIIKQSL